MNRAEAIELLGALAGIGIDEAEGGEKRAFIDAATAFSLLGVGPDEMPTAIEAGINNGWDGWKVPE